MGKQKKKPLSYTTIETEEGLLISISEREVEMDREFGEFLRNWKAEHNQEGKQDDQSLLSGNPKEPSLEHISYKQVMHQDGEYIQEPTPIEFPPGYDELLTQAGDLVVEMRSGSVSLLQRKLKLGYSRAARIVDQLEGLGVIGPYEGAKPRTTLINEDEWEALKEKIEAERNQDKEQTEETTP